jgi:L-rhamnose mutarotase
VDFYNCRFEHLASTGLDYNIAVHHNTVNGNLFKDIGGNGIVAGVYSDEATEIHLPYNPTDDREVCDGMTISNNLVTDVSNEDWSCVGIGIGYARNSTVSHNEVENVSYSAITMGWGWSPSANAMKNNRITANKIHHFGKHNYDCAGIYTLSAQPNTIISCNEIDSIYKAPYAHLPSHWFYLYTDEGSSYIHVTNNWTPSTKYLQNANGPGNQWTNNGPQVHDSIRNNAGLQADFQYLRKEKTASANHLPINEVHKEIIEIVVQQDKSIDLQLLKTILIKSSIDTNALYQWKNHYVIFDYIEDILVLQGRLKNNFPGAEVKSYPDLFYTFDKQKHCINPAISKEWDHIILTANLVDNKQLQQEYLNAHATQFEKWPEVAKGFCNANFQQLLVYRNNRQLMLVISIPKGESLDHLNPRTTANNPRMDQWNAAMKKYQEGIEGTAKGETWVFLQQIK